MFPMRAAVSGGVGFELLPGSRMRVQHVEPDEKAFQRKLDGLSPSSVVRPDAIAAAGSADTGAYIEVVTYAASPLAEKLHEAVKTLYKP